MPTSAFDKMVEQVRALTPDQLRRLRALVDAALARESAEEAEDAFERALHEAGLLREPRRRPSALAQDYRAFEPVKVVGKPVSETIIEERR